MPAWRGARRAGTGGTGPNLKKILTRCVRGFDSRIADHFFCHCAPNSNAPQTSCRRQPATTRSKAAGARPHQGPIHHQAEHAAGPAPAPAGDGAPAKLAGSFKFQNKRKRGLQGGRTEYSATKHVCSRFASHSCLDTHQGRVKPPVATTLCTLW